MDIDNYFRFQGELGWYTVYNPNEGSKLIQLWYDRPLKFKVAKNKVIVVLGELQINGSVDHVFCKIKTYRRDDILDELAKAYLDGDRLILEHKEVYKVLWANNYTQPKTGFWVKKGEMFFGDGVKTYRIATYNGRRNSAAFYDTSDIQRNIIHYRLDGSVKQKLNHENFSRTLVFPLELTVTGSQEEQDAWNRYFWPEIYCDFSQMKPSTGSFAIGSQIL